MGTSALGGFVEGLQGGMKFRQDKRRNKRIDKALDYRLAEMGRAEQGHMEDMELNAAGGAEGAVVTQDPYAEKLGWFGRWKKGIKEDYTSSPMGQLFGAGREQEKQAQVKEIEEAVPTAIPGYMADGGEVKRRFVDPETGVEFINGVPQSEVPTSGGDAWEATKDFGRNILGNTRRRVREWAPAGIETTKGIARAEGAAQRGAAIREDMQEGARGIGQVGMGLLEDVGVGPIARGVGGFIFGDDPNAPSTDTEAAISVAAQPNREHPVPDNFDPNMRLYPERAGAGAGAGGTQAPAQAVPTESEFQFNPKDVEDPGEIPRMSTRDWQEYRGKQVRALMLKGMSGPDAHDRVTRMQMEGFQNHAMQAWQLLGVGDWRSASASMTAAYQYFPNGADIKFGMHKDASGQPALVAMGTDEKTGEPVGQPMLINQERLSVMLNQLSDPAAFRSWTKDHRTEEFQRQIFEEYTKPIGKANAETARINARANEANAQARRASAIGAGGLKVSEVAGASDAFRERLSMLGLDPETERRGDQLAGVMEQVFQAGGGQWGRNAVIALVLAADDGDPDSVAVLEQLGINIALGE